MDPEVIRHCCGRYADLEYDDVFNDFVADLTRQRQGGGAAHVCAMLEAAHEMLAVVREEFS